MVCRHWLAAVAIVAAVIVGCGGSDRAEQSDRDHAEQSVRDSWPALDMKPEPGFDPDDPALDTLPDDDAHIDQLIRRAGRRKDFKVPRAAVANLADGPLVLAVVARPFYGPELDRLGLKPLNVAQRAVYAIFRADFEILNGGFAQLWYNDPEVSNHLVAAAERVGAREHLEIFRDAAALWPQAIPADETRLDAQLDRISDDALRDIDERYVATQFKRKTALATVLGRYIRANIREFVTTG